MKRNVVTRTTLASVFALAVVSLVPSAHAEQCSLMGVAGEYEFFDSGTIVGVGPRTTVGILTLDAAGNVVNGKATSSSNGVIADEAFSGTYTVNPDCTGTFSVNVHDPSGNPLFAATLDLAWDDEDMSDLWFVFTSGKLPNGIPLSIVISGDARKLSAKSDNASTVNSMERSSVPSPSCSQGSDLQSRPDVADPALTGETAIYAGHCERNGQFLTGRCHGALSIKPPVICWSVPDVQECPSGAKAIWPGKLPCVQWYNLWPVDVARRCSH